MRYFTRLGPNSGVSLGPFGTAVALLARSGFYLLIFAFLALAYVAIAVAALAGGAYLRWHERDDPAHHSLATYVYGLWRGFGVRIRRVGSD